MLYAISKKVDINKYPHKNLFKLGLQIPSKISFYHFLRNDRSYVFHIFEVFSKTYSTEEMKLSFK